MNDNETKQQSVPSLGSFAPSLFNPSVTAAARQPELDGLRAVAILLVLFHHALVGVPIAAVRQITGFGWVGVDLFFVLSGFLIGGILLDQRGAVNYYSVFYLRRFLRIVPLYAVLILPALLATGLGLQSLFKGHSLAAQSAAAIWLYPFFLQNIGAALLVQTPAYLGPAWSLAVEEQFYLLLPPLVRHLRWPRLRGLLLLAVVSAPLFRAGLWWIFGAKAGPACFSLLPCRWDALLLGVLAAGAVRDPELREWLATRLPWLRLAWLGLAGGLGAAVFLGLDRLDARMQIVGYTWTALFFTGTLLLATLNQGGGLNRWLSHPALKPIAMVSYGLYLLQGPAQAVVESVSHRWSYAPISWTATGVSMVGLGGTALAAAVSWKFYESRCLRLAHQFRYRTAPEGCEAQAEVAVNKSSR
jgi:peptidoglycan/LPS O-acetylase OafA/YrhL